MAATFTFLPKRRHLTYSTSTNTNFTIPSIGQSQNQSFDDVDWVAVGQYVFLSDGVNYGTFKVVTIDVPTLTLTLLNQHNNVHGTTIQVLARLVPSGTDVAATLTAGAGLEITASVIKKDKTPVALTPGTTVSVNCDTTDIATLTPAQNFTMSNPTGTPSDAQGLMFRITNTTFTITWGTIYRGSTDIALPSLSTNKTDYFYFRYNSVSVKWDLLCSVKGF